MEGPLKELAALELATSDNPSSKGKLPAIQTSLDALLQSLRDVRTKLDGGIPVAEAVSNLSKSVDTRKKEVDDRQKEVYTIQARLGKAVDKKFTNVLPTYDPMFTSESAVSSLERSIALHYLRTGQFGIANVLIEEAGIDVPPELQHKFVDLYRILEALRNRSIEPALDWASRHRTHLQDRSSPLEFNLHRSQYLRLLTSSTPSALAYAKAHFTPFYTSYMPEIRRLMACMVYLPLSRLQHSPYADLAADTVHTDLEPLFAQEWCAIAGMSKQLPLRVVGDIGGGGALARIEKGRKVMKERKGGWSQTDELPMEIPLPPENRYHSIFACPVSKEQASDENPPVMMACGHVITKDSLQKLSKPAGRVKCPYCPVESQVSTVLRVYF